MGAMEFLGTPGGQLSIAVAVGLVGVGVGAAYFLLSSKKPKGFHFILLMLFCLLNSVS